MNYSIALFLFLLCSSNAITAEQNIPGKPSPELIEAPDKKTNLDSSLKPMDYPIQIPTIDTSDEKIKPPFDQIKPPILQQLPLRDALVETLLNQLEIKISLMNIQAQQGVLQHDAGPFDPVFDGSLKTTHSENIQNRFIEVKTNSDADETVAQLSAVKKTRLGTTFTATADVDRTNNFLFFVPKPINFSNASFRIDQPLLRDLIYGKDAVTEMAAKWELFAIYYDNFQTISEKILNTTVQYWEFAAAKKLVEISKNAEKRIEKLIEGTKELIRQGQLASSDIIQPLTNLINQKLQTVLLQQQFYNALQELKFNMGDTEVATCDDAYYIVDEFPSADFDYVEFQETMGCLINYAIAHRYDIKASEMREEEAAVLLKGAYNEELPQVNVFAEVKTSDFKVGKRSKPLFSSLDMHHPETDWTIGFNFSFPLYNDSAIGDVRQQQAEKYKAMLNTQLLMQTTMKDLREALINQLSIAVELEKATKLVKENHLLVENETKKLRAGFSNLFFILDFENRLTDSLNSQVNFHKQFLQNIARLRFLSATLFRLGPNYDLIQLDDVTVLPDFGKPCKLP